MKNFSRMSKLQIFIKANLIKSFRLQARLQNIWSIKWIEKDLSGLDSFKVKEK